MNLPNPVAYQYRLVRGDYYVRIAEERERGGPGEDPLFTAEQVAELMYLAVSSTKVLADFRAVYCKVPK